MKTLSLLVCCFFTLSLAAQDCPSFYYFQDHSTLELTNYNRKDKPEGRVVYKVTEVKKDGDGTTSTIASEIYDDKDKLVANSQVQFKCIGSSLYMDMQMALPSGSMDQFKDMEVKTSKVFMEYPASMQAGEDLEDGSFHMEIVNKGKHVADMDYEITNRKVEAKETISTDAGTWDCYKITYDGKMTINMGISIPVRMKVAEWFAPGVGVVKTADYNKKGKLRGYTLLTKYEK